MSGRTLKGILAVLGVLVPLWLGSVLLSGRGGGGPAPGRNFGDHPNH